MSKGEWFAVSVGIALLYVAWQVHKQGRPAPAFIRVNQSFDATTFGWES